MGQRQMSPVGWPARATICAGGVLSMLALGTTPQQPGRSWTVALKPELVIGNSDSDTSSLERVVGATRLPNGQIIVGDLGAYALRVFSPEGKALRSVGRTGSGPGEISYLRFLLRCGDSLFTADIGNGHRVDVRALDGTRVRTYRFGSPQGGRVPYSTACNADRHFAHYGWEALKQPKAGVYRERVPFWTSGPDSAIAKTIGSFAGSERFGKIAKRGAGSRPLPLGKEPVIAIGRDRVYIGTAERYEIMVFDLAGARQATIRKPHVPVETTAQDIQYSIDLAVAGRPDSVRQSITGAYGLMPIPKTLPAYAAFVVDQRDLLWVADYPRPQAQTRRWTVFDRQARLVSEVALPAHLEVFEIGADYVLGRYVHPEDAVPEVRMYRLTRGR